MDYSLPAEPGSFYSFIPDLFPGKAPPTEPQPEVETKEVND